ncbi:class D sortase [Paenibacillaceae bacterium]|nr:class D sortase [Paenibacillaceae bacterium]
MLKKFSTLLFFIGVCLLIYCFCTLIYQNNKINQNLRDAERILSIRNDPLYNEQLVLEQDMAQARAQFKARDNEVIGTLEIPKLNEKLPILEGTDDETLAQGVGHFKSTAFPLDNEQILLSGHRDTVFRKFGQLELGDLFVVNMPYGSFEYVIKATEIVDKEDTTVIRKMGEEVLTISTCYPFRYLGNAPERYIFYAYPHNSESKEKMM